MSASQPQLFESRVIATLITGRPKNLSFIQSLGTVLVIGIITLIYWKNHWGVADSLYANKHLVFEQGQWWRVFTATLIHQDLGHYLSNMLMLFVFGFFINSYFGAKTFPFLTFLVSGVVNAISIYTYDSKINLLGASGYVFVLGGFWLCLYFLIQRQYLWFNRLLRVLGIGLVLFFPTSFAPQTSYRTHLIGFAAGVLFGILYFIFEKKNIRKFEVVKVIQNEEEGADRF